MLPRTRTVVPGMVTDGIWTPKADRWRRRRCLRLTERDFGPAARAGLKARIVRESLEGQIPRHLEQMSPQEQRRHRPFERPLRANGRHGSGESGLDLVRLSPRVARIGLERIDASLQELMDEFAVGAGVKG